MHENRSADIVDIVRGYLESQGASVTKIVDTSDTSMSAVDAHVIRMPRRFSLRKFNIGDIHVSVIPFR